MVRYALGNRIAITILSKGIALQRLTEKHTFIRKEGILNEIDFDRLIFDLIAYTAAYPEVFSLDTAARDFIEKNRRQSYMTGRMFVRPRLLYSKCTRLYLVAQCNNFSYNRYRGYACNKFQHK